MWMLRPAEGRDHAVGAESFVPCGDPDRDEIALRRIVADHDRAIVPAERGEVVTEALHAHRHDAVEAARLADADAERREEAERHLLLRVVFELAERLVCRQSHQSCTELDRHDEQLVAGLLLRQLLEVLGGRGPRGHARQLRVEPEHLEAFRNSLLELVPLEDATEALDSGQHCLVVVRVDVLPDGEETVHLRPGGQVLFRGVLVERRVAEPRELCQKRGPLGVQRLAYVAVGVGRHRRPPSFFDHGQRVLMDLHRTRVERTLLERIFRCNKLISTQIYTTERRTKVA